MLCATLSGNNLPEPERMSGEASSVHDSAADVGPPNSDSDLVFTPTSPSSASERLGTTSPSQTQLVCPGKRPADDASASTDIREQSSSPSDTLLFQQRADDDLEARVCICQPEPKIPRPRNAFILYRQHYQGHVVSQHPGLANPEISKIIGSLWQNQSNEVKNKWKNLAEEEKTRHQQQYPAYRYQPRRNVRNNLTGQRRNNDTDKGPCAKCGGRSAATMAPAQHQNANTLPQIASPPLGPPSQQQTLIMGRPSPLSEQGSSHRLPTSMQDTHAGSSAYQGRPMLPPPATSFGNTAEAAAAVEGKRRRFSEEQSRGSARGDSSRPPSSHATYAGPHAGIQYRPLMPSSPSAYAYSNPGSYRHVENVPGPWREPNVVTSVPPSTKAGIGQPYPHILPATARHDRSLKLPPLAPAQIPSDRSAAYNRGNDVMMQNHLVVPHGPCRGARWRLDSMRHLVQPSKMTASSLRGPIITIECDKNAAGAELLAKWLLDNLNYYKTGNFDFHLMEGPDLSRLQNSSVESLPALTHMSYDLVGLWTEKSQKVVKSLLRPLFDVSPHKSDSSATAMTAATALTKLSRDTGSAKWVSSTKGTPTGLTMQRPDEAQRMASRAMNNRPGSRGSDSHPRKNASSSATPMDVDGMNQSRSTSADPSGTYFKHYEGGVRVCLIANYCYYTTTVVTRLLTALPKTNADPGPTSRLLYDPREQWEWAAGLWGNSAGPDLTIYICDEREVPENTQHCENKSGVFIVPERDIFITSATHGEQADSVNISENVLRSLKHEVDEWCHWFASAHVPTKVEHDGRSTRPVSAPVQNWAPRQ